MFFIVVYLHIFRGLYFGSYASPRELVWCVGVVILLLMILTAFIGYVLPWGQMSFWGATVIIAGASIIHIAALHQYGSNNPLGIDSHVDKMAFHPYCVLKDVVAWVTFGIFFAVFVYFAPNFLGHPDNYIPANPMSTPAHIVPEWYFLWVYAILRSIPNKLGGVAAIALVFVCLFTLPFLSTSEIRSSN